MGRWFLLIGAVLQGVAALGALTGIFSLFLVRRLSRLFSYPWLPRGWWGDLPFAVSVIVSGIQFLLGVAAFVLLFVAWRAAQRSKLQRAGILGIVGGAIAVFAGFLGVVGLIGGILCLLAVPPSRPVPVTAPAPGTTPTG